MTKVINILGGPGVGKSTQAADVFSILKKRGVNCELVTEYVKDLVWQESFRVIENQLYIFAKQHQKMFRLRNKVDVMITDSPLLNSLFYIEPDDKHFKNSYEFFEKLVISEFNNYENFNYLLKRETKYEQSGRNQDLDGAIKVDAKIINFLSMHNINYKPINLIGAASIISKDFI